MSRKWSLPVIALIASLLPSINFAANPLSPGAPVNVTATTAAAGAVVTPPVVSGNATGFMTTFTIFNTVGFSPSFFAFSGFSSNDGASWTTPPINTLTTTDVFPTWVSGNATGFVASWVDTDPSGPPSSNAPNTSLYQSGTWSSPDQIDNAEPATIYSVVAGTTVGFVVTWRGSNALWSSFAPSGTSWTDHMIHGICAMTSQVFVSGVSSNFMAILEESGVGHPFFSDDGAGAIWTPMSLLFPSVPAASDFWISGTTDGFMVTWRDTSEDAFSSFTTDNGNTWSTASPIATGLAANTDVAVSGSDVGFVATWIDSMGGAHASFSSDQGTTWSPAVTIDNNAFSSGTSAFAWFVGVSVVGSEVMFTWTGTDANVYSSFCTIGGAPSVLQPPQNLSGNQKKNKFGTFFERFNLLQWNPSPSTGVAGYYVYRNGVKIATLNATTFQYEDHNQKKGAVTSYAITAFDASGDESAPVDITIN